MINEKPEIRVTLNHYRFDCTKPDEAKAWADLQAVLLARKIKVWSVDRRFNQYCKAAGDIDKWLETVRLLDGKSLVIEIEHLFGDQWNTAPYDGADSGLRVWQWVDVKYHNANIREGYYLTDVDALFELLKQRQTCGYCGYQEDVDGGHVFCPKCLASQYLKERDLPLTRMVSVAESFNAKRAPLTPDELAERLPLYKEAQLHGTTERGKKRIAKAKADIETEYEKTIAEALEKRDAARWIVANIPGLLENWIFYSHTGRHCFGWRTKLDETVLSGLLDVISEFPFAYEIECADGRKLSN